MEQALEYYPKLRYDEIPRFVLACNFEKWYLQYKEDNSTYEFTLADLPDKIGLFGFMVDKPNMVETDPVNEKAGEIMADIFDSLKKGSFEKGGSVEFFLTRIAFCLFADNTGIFEHKSFQQYVKDTKSDGSDLGMHLKYLFDILDTPNSRRPKNLHSNLKQFQYIDGALFDHTDVQFPEFTSETRKLLIQASDYDWSKVSPVIFGSMFQNVMDQDARREIGAHYTTEENILKVTRPLFLTQLYQEFNDIVTSDDSNKLELYKQLQHKLSSLKFLDPACGSGNFLSITYRELRKLEHKILYKLKQLDDTTEIKSQINVHQFYGIELARFSAKIAEVSLWMMDHLMNLELNAMFEPTRYRLPLSKKPYITCTDALIADWNDILLSDDCDYILGNPPFSGSKQSTEEQRNQIKQLTKPFKVKGGTLDFVSGWFIRAGQYAKNHTKIGFVSTKSITHGEQVGQLWQILLDHCKLDIIFAYKPFLWSSETKNTAAVTVVIIGLSKNPNDTRYLYHKDDVKETPHISPYLIEASTRLPIVSTSTKAINGLPKMIMGSKPIDDGNYIFTKQKKIEFLRKEPRAKHLLRPYLSADDFINNNMRYILTLHDTSPKQLKSMPKVLERIKKVAEFRANSPDETTRKLSETPRLYHLNVIPNKPYLLVPRVSSENRRYVPIGFVEPPIIPSDATLIVQDATMGLFGLLTSRMHMVWLSVIGGRLDNRFRYSKGIVYNTFPVPNKPLDKLEKLAQNILDIRAKYSTSSLADLYYPNTMYPDLLKAHQKLDRAVERLYRKEPFKDDDERLEFLLIEYAKMVKAKTTIEEYPTH